MTRFIDPHGAMRLVWCHPVPRVQVLLAQAHERPDALRHFILFLPEVQNQTLTFMAQGGFPEALVR